MSEKNLDRTPFTPATIVELLRWRAAEQATQLAYTYLPDNEMSGPSLNYEQLDREARAISVLISEHCQPGERALLLYPAGLEFISAFFACLYSGVIAIPVPPPDLKRPERTMPRIEMV
jgi:acyl-CoA synthetase (AMP-forming)/AMP-acid ligase II